MSTLLKAGECRCTLPPPKDSGLQLYDRGQVYRFERLEDSEGRAYCRVYRPNNVSFQTCSAELFGRHFAEVTPPAGGKARAARGPVKEVIDDPDNRD